MAYYLATGLVIALGVTFSAEFVRPRESSPAGGVADPVASCVRFDGTHYRDIALRGYHYDPGKRSTVAFFPAYPLAARAVRWLTGLDIESALLLVSNAGLALAFSLLAVYARNVPDPVGPDLPGWTLLAFGLWPGSFFFRMAYAESLFLAAALLVLVGMRQSWRPWTLALAAGLVTATRPVGVAASAAVFWHILRDGQVTLTVRIRRALLLAPVTCWGLLGYMGYQQAAFGNALAFAQTQEHWTHGTEGDGSELPGKLWSLATLEPIRGVFDPRSPRYWSLGGWDQNPLFNLFLWNPILFLAAAGLVALGAARRWLSGPEVVFGAALVAIPYVTRSYEMSMASHARFASVVVVIYPVLGRLLASLPAPVASAGLVWSAAMLLSWTALYAAGYVLY